MLLKFRAFVLKNVYFHDICNFEMANYFFFLRIQLQYTQMLNVLILPLIFVKVNRNSLSRFQSDYNRELGYILQKSNATR